MTERRFDGRVVVITGAGRGLGRAYAELLGARGAKIVVNDVGASLAGAAPGENIANAGPAQMVVDAITAAGGEAVANTDTVATEAGGKAIIETALDSFGRIDCLIHNAGNVRYGALDEISYDDFCSVINVHLLGAFHVVRPAFPRMKQAGFGRVVLTGSIGGLYSTPRVVNYAMSKSGMIGLNNIIAIEGAEFNVKSNIILPGAVTRMADGLDISQYPPMGTDLVAPVVGWLAHDSCSISGEMLISLGGRVARAFIAETEGIYRQSWTIDDVGDNIAAIRDPARQWTLHPLDGAGGYFEHLTKSFEMVKRG